MKEILKHIDLFRELPDEHLAKLGQLVQQQVYQKGETIVVQGSVGDGLYIICAGEVEINQLIDAESQRVKTIAVVRKGDFFGEMSLLAEGQTRSANVVALCETKLLVLPQKTFITLMDENSVLARSVLAFFVKKLADRLRESNMHFVTVFETGMIIGSTRNMHEMGRLVLDKLCFVLPQAEGGLMLMWNEYNREYNLVASKGYDETLANRIAIDHDEPFLRYLATTQKAVLVEDADREQRFRLDQTHCYTGSSMLGGPLLDLDADRVLGFIILTNWRSKAAFQIDDRILLETVTNQIAPAAKLCMYRSEEEDRRRLERRRF